MSAMKDVLNHAYACPGEGGVFYTAGGTIASPRLTEIGAWDWTPEPTRYVGGGTTCLFALGMGCTPTQTSDGKLWIEKRIHDPAQVRDLATPDLTAGAPGTVLANLDQAVADLGPRERVRCTDIQSPLGVAELMWDESFYIALFEQPAAVHDLLDRITDFIIAFIQEYQRRAGGRLNPCGFPALWAEGTGTMVADDTMSLVSPEMHLEFSVPYLNRIARACGPLYYHSCTWREPYFDNIHQIENVVTYNWNPGDSIDFGIIAREFGGRAVIAPHLVLDMHREKGALAWERDFADEFDFFTYLVESTPPDAAFYLFLSNIREKVEVVERIYDWLDQRGHTPQARGVTV